MSKNYRYHLLKYHGKSSRLTCPNCGRPYCFSPYVDDDDNIIGPEYGRCDHESSCGYVKYPPSQDESWREPPARYSKPKNEHKSLRKPEPQPEGKFCTVPMDIVTKTIRTNPLSDFLRFLSTILDTDTIIRLVTEYRIGVTKSGDVIFWQFVIQGRCRGGKVMKFDAKSGHRIKDDSVRDRLTWVHALKPELFPQGWTMSQCLYGSHLLPKYPDKIVFLVEAEKTAILGSAVFPDAIWVATGGKSLFNERVDVLEGRKIVVFPDADAYDLWKEKMLEHPWLNMQLSDYLKNFATPEQLANGADVADVLIEWLRGNDLPAVSNVSPVTEPIRTIQENPTLRELRKYISPEYWDQVAAFVEELGLELVSVTKIQSEQ